jgi:hypothetical protein
VCRQPAAEAVEQLHGVEIGRQRRDVELGDDGGAVAEILHQPFRRQPDQCLAHRRARDAELPADLGFVEQGAGHQLQVQDPVLELLVHIGRAGPARPARIAGGALDCGLGGGLTRHGECRACMRRSGLSGDAADEVAS